MRLPRRKVSGAMQAHQLALLREVGQGQSTAPAGMRLPGLLNEKFRMAMPGCFWWMVAVLTGKVSVDESYSVDGKGNSAEATSRSISCSSCAAVFVAMTLFVIVGPALAKLDDAAESHDTAISSGIPVHHVTAEFRLRSKVARGRQQPWSTMRKTVTRKSAYRA